MHALPFDKPDQLIWIAGTAPGTDMPAEFGVPPELYLHYKEHSRTLENLAIVNSFTSTYRDGDRVERIRMSAPTIDVFQTLRVTPILGRLPMPDDGDKVAVMVGGVT